MIFIGIDPDVEKSGFAVWDSEKRELVEVRTYCFFELVERLKDFVLFGCEIRLVIEAGWLIKKSNFHGRKGQSKSVGEKIAKAVGANHQIGKLLVEWCAFNGVLYKEIKPQGKLSAIEFKRVTGWDGRTNSEQRDSAMLVFSL